MSGVPESKLPDGLPERNAGQLPRNVKLLGWTSCLNDVASEMIYPLLPLFLITVLGGNRLALGVIEGVADSAASLLKLWSGARSDRSTRRKGFVLFGYGLAALSRPLLSTIFTPWQLFAARAADRIGKGIRTSPRDAMIADSTPKELHGRAFGFHRAMDHGGAALGPALAAIFLWFWPDQLRSLFLLTLLPGIAVMLILAFGLKEPPQTAPIDDNNEKRGRLTLQPFGRDFRVFLVSLIVFTLGNSTDAFLLVRAGELGVPTVMLPLLWFVFHVAKSGGNLIVGRFVDRAGPLRPLRAGWLLYAVVYLLFGIATETWHVWALFLVYAIYYALTEPAEKTLVSRLVGEEHKGLAFGWFNCAIGISALPASLLFGLLYDQFGPLAAFGWGAALALLALGLLTAVHLPPDETKLERDE
ncbi:MAG: MFS transporter [Rhodopirellula sp.]|nr:MFS transporter [Rhodopirellula sp.]